MVIFFTVLLDLLGFGMILPLLPYYALDFGASPTGVTLLFASFSLAQFVFAPLWGRLSDRVGRRPVLLGSIAGAVVAYLVFAFAGSFLVLLAARVAAGIAAANYSIAQAWIADTTPPEDRAKGMGFLGAAFGVGFVLGPVLGGLVGGVDWTGLGMAWLASPSGAEAASYRAVALAAALLSLADLALAYFLVPESLAPGERSASGRWLSLASFRQGFSTRRLAGLMVLYGVVIFAFSGMESTLGLYVERPEPFGFDFQQTAWLFTYIGVILAVVQGGLIGPLTRRFGERRLVLAGVASMAAGLVLLPFGGSVAWLAGTSALLTIGMGLHNPTTLSLVSRQTDAASQGSVLGVARSLGALARGVGPLWGGFAFAEIGTGAPFWSSGIVMAAALGFAAVLFRGRFALLSAREPSC